MQRLIHILATVVVACGLTACGSLPRTGTAPEPDAPVGIDGVACVGRITTAVPGTTEIRDPESVRQAQDVSGKGGICAGKSFVAQAGVRVYRVWDASRAGSELGRWWGLSKPAGPRDQYRQDFAICAARSALDRLVACDVKPGSELVIGTTQSIDCDEATYPKSANQQVYLRNDASTATLLVENCRDEGVWP